LTSQTASVQPINNLRSNVVTAARTRTQKFTLTTCY